MSDYKPSQVLSIRIDPELLAAVRERATEEGRSVSGEIVSMVRERLGALAARSDPSRPITGWLAGLEVPSTHAEFHEARTAASASLARSAQRDAPGAKKRKRPA